MIYGNILTNNYEILRRLCEMSTISENQNLPKNNKLIISKPWYLQTWLISFIFIFSVFIIPFVIGLILLIKHYLFEKKQKLSLKEEMTALQQQIDKLQLENKSIYTDLENYKSNYEKLSTSINGEQQEIIRIEIQNLIKEKESLESNIQAASLEYSSNEVKFDKKLQSIKLKIKSANTALKAIYKAIDTENFVVPELMVTSKDLMQEVYDMHINSLDTPSLRKLFNLNRENTKQIIEKYESRYTTKGNKAIYQLMVLALEAELQDVLLNLKFGTVDKSKSRIKELSKKYYEISANGNQSIAPTIQKFISEIEVLYIEAVEIEYEYYVQKEKVKEEQRALKEQMRQEAEEKRILEQQQKQVEKEEQKYKNEIENVKVAISTSNSDEIEKLQKKLNELQEMLTKVESKKEEIVNLQNGQAGHVYVISNIGSFGDNVFKIGMTRRLDPQERVDELGSASVPFPFDVHSFIFSENAVDLENNLHKILDNQRVNKINKRKEFFAIDITELENIVHKIDPSAEFKMTALAEQYNQSLALAKN